MTWVDEFGVDYAVPDEIVNTEGIEDWSWHNDACPAFGQTVGQHRLTLWVEHVDPGQRAYPMEPAYNHRFMVTYDYEGHLADACPNLPNADSNWDWCLYAGEDTRAALDAFCKAMETVHAFEKQAS
jgi:hypothetical protein